jgi:hypothetical protein
VENERAEFASIVAFLAWALVYQRVQDTFAAHPSWKNFMDKTCGEPSGLTWVITTLFFQALSAFSVWNYWNNPGLNTILHLTTLGVWIIRQFFYRIAMSVYSLSEEHIAFRIIIDLLILLMDYLFVILCIVETAQRKEPKIAASIALYLPALVLDTLIFLALLFCSSSSTLKKI